MDGREAKIHRSREKGRKAGMQRRKGQRQTERRTGRLPETYKQVRRQSHKQEK